MTDGDGGGLCGFSTKETYDLALHFMHEKDGSKAVAMSYQDKLKLAALAKQAAKGPFNPEQSPDVGFLDRVGNDRKEAWRQLGDMSREKAMTELVNLVDRLSPLFRPYLEAHRANRLEQERVRQEVISQDQKSAESEVLARQAAEYQRWLEHEASIRAALNEQTAVQFKHYAEQQYPNEPEKQAELIHQLQEQHFQQFMTHWYQQQQQYAANTSGQTQQQQQGYSAPDQQQSLPQQNQDQNGGQMPTVVPPPAVVPVANIPIQGAADSQHAAPPPQQPYQTAQQQAQQDNQQRLLNFLNDTANASQGQQQQQQQQQQQVGAQTAALGAEQQQNGGEPMQPIPMAPVRLWTHKNTKQFKDTIKRENSEAIIKIGSGESITIRVPTNSDATSLYWEFMTDSYDVGFGVFFEWQPAEDDQVRIQLSDSEEEEEEEEGAGEGAEASNEGADGDVEKGARRSKKDGPPVDELVALTRRDSHVEVQCGSHDFAPARGVYLLRFDNSYSLWRSKTLYYRIYYAK